MQVVPIADHDESGWAGRTHDAIGSGDGCAVFNHCVAAALRLPTRPRLRGFGRPLEPEAAPIGCKSPHSRIDSSAVAPDAEPVRKSLTAITRARIALARNRPSEAYALIAGDPVSDAQPLGGLPLYAERRLVTAIAAEASGQWQTAVRIKRAVAWKSWARRNAGFRSGSWHARCLHFGPPTQWREPNHAIGN